MARSGKLLVAAIDFGTTYSGSAFSNAFEFKHDPLKVHLGTWTSCYGSASHKIPATVLLDPSTDFHSFGLEAEDHYLDLELDDKHKDWFYFPHIMNMLDEKERKGELTRNVELQDIGGRELPAIKVFSYAIEDLKRYLLRIFEALPTDLKNSDIQWVLTVPNIWNYRAKQFMREAAEKAGIKAEDLIIALKSEAASLYCKHLPVEKLCCGSDQGFTCFSKGSKYLVLDAGERTVDITVHEVKDDGSLKELDKASVSVRGSSHVDETFKQLLIKIVGNPVMQRFRQEQTSDFDELFRRFETKQRRITFGHGLPSDKITILIPIALEKIFMEETEEDISEALNQSAFAGKLYWKRGKMRMTHETFNTIFPLPIQDTVTHIRALLSKPSCEGTTTIIMVGEISESPLFQSGIRENFPPMKIIIPPDSDMSVLKGAVIFGHESFSKKSPKQSKYTV